MDSLDNAVRDHSTSASARHHVQRMDARIEELKRTLRSLLLGGGGRGDLLSSGGFAGET